IRRGPAAGRLGRRAGKARDRGRARHPPRRRARGAACVWRGRRALLSSPPTVQERRKPRTPDPGRASKSSRPPPLLQGLHPMTGLLCYCRAGFEPELAAELTARAGEAGFAGYARTDRGSGFVVFACDQADALSRALPWRGLVFARQKLRVLAQLRGLDPKDRIGPMLAALGAGAAGDGEAGQDARANQVRARPYGSLFVEHPDSDTGKPLAGLARAFGNALRPALRKAGLLAARDDA